MDLMEIFSDSEDVESYSAGTVIISEGEEGDRMYVVIDGRVTVSLQGKTLATAGRGEIVGEMALISTDIRSATVTADTDCRLVPIYQNSFEALLRHVPEFAVYVIHLLADRLQNAYEIMRSE